MGEKERASLKDSDFYIYLQVVNAKNISELDVELETLPYTQTTIFARHWVAKVGTNTA